MVSNLIPCPIILSIMLVLANAAAGVKTPPLLKNTIKPQ